MFSDILMADLNWKQEIFELYYLSICFILVSIQWQIVGKISSCLFGNSAFLWTGIFVCHSCISRKSSRFCSQDHVHNGLHPRHKDNFHYNIVWHLAVYLFLLCSPDTLVMIDYIILSLGTTATS